MKVRNPKHLHDKKLSSRFDEDDQTNNKNMVAFTSMDAIKKAIKEEKDVVFWALNLKLIKDELEKRLISFKPVWDNPPHKMRSLSIYIKKKIAVRIKQVQWDAPMLETACEYFRAQTGNKLNYKGETTGVINHGTGS